MILIFILDYSLETFKFGKHPLTIPRKHYERFSYSNETATTWVGTTRRSSCPYKINRRRPRKEIQFTKELRVANEKNITRLAAKSRPQRSL